jgi:L-ribulose-5-phosphate 3-epimerase
MDRRTLLATACALPLAAVSPLSAKTRFGRDRLSALTDECARTPEGAIEFAHKFGLKFLEVRAVPGRKGQHYFDLPQDELKTHAKMFRDAGIKISYFNTPFLKITLPGTEPVFNKPETPEQRAKRVPSHQAAFDRRLTDLRTAIASAQILGVNRLRVFSFLRVPSPDEVMPRVVDILGEMANICEKEGMMLLVENEQPCIAATTAELVKLVNLLPEKSVGMNWDPTNGFHRGEVPFPDGYKLIPMKRLGNVQVKGKSVLTDKERLDWATIFQTLAKDGYKHKVGLETHYLDGTDPEKSVLVMERLVKMVEPS